MKIPKLKKFEPIEILWDDSTQASGNVWFQDKQFEHFRDEIIYFKSVGYFMEVKHDNLFMVGGFSAYKDNGDISQTTKLEKIPIGCIKEIKKLK